MGAAKYKPMTGRARPPHFNEGFKMANKIRVWDLPTRVFHWALVACVLGLVVTGKVGGAWIDWHARLGYAVLALLLFRLVWGLVGGRWSRFAAFIYAPGSVINYLKGTRPPGPPDRPQPAGRGVGLCHAAGAARAGGHRAGQRRRNLVYRAAEHAVSPAPPACWPPRTTSRYGQWLVIGLVVLHVAAILVLPLVRKKDNLIRPMLSGDKPGGMQAPTSPRRLTPRPALLAAVIFGVCAGFCGLAGAP
jgi:cytochrome b